MQDEARQLQHAKAAEIAECGAKSDHKSDPGRREEIGRKSKHICRKTLVCGQRQAEQQHADPQVRRQHHERNGQGCERRQEHRNLA